MKDKLFGRTETGSQYWVPLLIALLVALAGLITINSTLEALVHLKHSRVVDADAHSTLLAGLSLIYLATLLRRGKYTAWLISIGIFIFLVIRNFRHFDYDISGDEMYNWSYFLNSFLPVVILAGLILGRKFFNVRSEILSFTTAVRRSILVVIITLLYGGIGFQLLDVHDFHQQIAIQTGVHYTVDQLGLTTNNQLTPYTRRGHLFLDSLAAISLGSLFYVAVSFFSPIRFRLASHQQDWEIMRLLLNVHPSSSEDFFKLWPHDKAYFFTQDRSVGIAYRAVGGVALGVGDPVGDSRAFGQALIQFKEFCRLNDWRPSFIHTLQEYNELYKNQNFDIQKIGEEAVVDLKHFTEKVARNKYFRHITNKFEKQGWRSEVLVPPHNDSVLQRLKEISDDWLKVPGRSERGFMMGYFSEDYLQQCTLMVVRDAAGTMQAFVNQIPSFDHQEANYDFLRHTKHSLGNINDFLMVDFIKYLTSQGFQKLNMGLCPLSGLKERQDENYDIVDKFLNLVYQNTSRFYSFQGLRRFKEKYEPQWRDRFIVYQGGVVGLSKTMNSLVRAMRLPKRH